MKILVWGINYTPEVTGIAPYNQGMCEYLVEQGHEVHMLTTFPYYPEWKKRPEDEGLFYQSEMIKGVHVHRCWHYVPPQPTPLQRIMHEASFVCNAFLRGLLIQKVDRIVLVSPPLPLGIAGWVLSLWMGVPFVFHIQDLQPDAGVSMGLIRSPLLKWFLFACERLVYDKASKITVISEAMKRMLRIKKVPDSKIQLFPNWFHPLLVKSEGAFSFRNEYQVPQGALLMVYSGNFGKKQGLEIFVEVAARLSADRAHWIFCGDGAAREDLVARVKDLGLRHVHFLPLQETALYHKLLEESDLCLVSQIGGTGKFFFPSKLLSILSHGKPVITVADDDSELAHSVGQGFGVNHSNHNPDEIAQTIVQLQENRLKLAEMGQKGLHYVHRFDKIGILRKFLDLLKNLA